MAFMPVLAYQFSGKGNGKGGKDSPGGWKPSTSACLNGLPLLQGAQLPFYPVVGRFVSGAAWDFRAAAEYFPRKGKPHKTITSIWA
jgi:hypothetical protein